jgi:hypothetical protein
MLSGPQSGSKPPACTMGMEVRGFTKRLKYLSMHHGVATIQKTSQCVIIMRISSYKTVLSDRGSKYHKQNRNHVKTINTGLYVCNVLGHTVVRTPRFALAEETCLSYNILIFVVASYECIEISICILLYDFQFRDDGIMSCCSFLSGIIFHSSEIIAQALSRLRVHV